MSDQEAAHYVSLYWGGAMVGRFLGSALLAKFLAAQAARHLRKRQHLAAADHYYNERHTAMYSIVAIGLFNSIMFPTIFSLGIERMGPLTGKASSLLIMAIVGGAVMPFLQGFLADNIGIQHAFSCRCFVTSTSFSTACSGSYIRTAAGRAQQ
jgi:FHS family L-fucose permease-like MFS transporter